MQASLFTSFDYTSGMKGLPAIFAVAGLLFAFADPGLTPRKVPEEFPLHQETARLAIGAEFMVHSFGRDSEIYVNEDYLTVEVGIYPFKGNTVPVINTQFSLRINGKKDVLVPDMPSMVAMSLKYKDWDRISQSDGQGGGPMDRQGQNGPQFPGDTRGSGRLPSPPQAPAGVVLTAPEHVAPSVLLREVALPQGDARYPVAGYLYFPYHGKIKSIRTLDLTYNNGADSVTLRLR
jgi:hypothetical protein